MPQLTPHVENIGKTVVANNGQKMTIIDYINASDITIQFEDGTIVKHKRLRSFNAGEIKNPSLTRSTKSILAGKKYIGRTNTAMNGLKMTIIAYRNANDLDIQFEDGTVVCHKPLVSFNGGTVKHPNIFVKGNREYKGRVSKRKWIGEETVANNGQKMKIIDGTKTKDITVQFEDGTIVYHKSLSCFDSGAISNPNFHFSNKTKKTFSLSDRIGKESIATTGERMKVIAYRTGNDIDVQFEDGTIVEHRSYRMFLKGNIANPNFTGLYGKRATARNKHIGEIRNTPCGQTVKIVAYNMSKDIIAEFEDGTQVTTTYADFNRGLKNHPKLFTGQRTTFEYNNMICRFIYKDSSAWWYDCKCPRCNFNQILSAKEMIQPHICEN